MVKGFVRIDESWVKASAVVLIVDGTGKGTGYPDEDGCTIYLKGGVHTEFRGRAEELVDIIDGVCAKAERSMNGAHDDAP